MSRFLIDQRLRNNTGHPTAFRQHGIGNGPRQPDGRTAVYKLDRTLGQKPAQSGRGVQMFR